MQTNNEIGMYRFLSIDQIYSGESLIRSLIVNVTTNLTSNNTINSDEKTGMSWSNLLIVILMILLSAYCNGTNIGVMGLDVQQLELMSQGPYETEDEAKEGEMAKKLLPLRSKGL
jgi:hypothetical protein